MNSIYRSVIRPDKSIVGSTFKAIDICERSLSHYGTKRHSGRWPWGSGKNPYQHSGDWLSRVEQLKKEGLTQTEIAKSMGLKSTTDLRAYESIAKAERRGLLVDRARSLKEDGLGATEIARKMSEESGKTIGESTVRSLLNEDSEKKMKQARGTADFLKSQVDEKGMIDIGKGVELELSEARDLRISKEKMRQAITILKADGYETYTIGVPQATNEGQQTRMMVLCKPGTTYKDVYDHRGDIQTIKDYISNDGGETFERKTFKYPSSLDSNRVMIRYAEDGGVKKDGVIEIRKGVEDISLGNSKYAQVRILVDDKYYMKGMAMYSDGKDMPPGVDIIYNSNKSNVLPKEKVFKPIVEGDKGKENPFGSYIKIDGQREYIDKNGDKKLSPINKIREEGEWLKWSKNLAAQFLSKQQPQMIKKQLDLSYSDREAEYKEILELTNPTIRKKLLADFADNCASAAVKLKAASFPRQQTQVLLPIPTLKDNEVYAPNFKNGEKIALIRYPHGGTFEIPILTVNNKQKDAVSILGKNPIDAIGINTTVAERLSGADFDGDTVICIPTGNGRVNVKSTDPLKGLEGFDPKVDYKGTTIDGEEIPGIRYIRTDEHKGIEMGKVTNLITDMTIKGAPEDEIARAVKHSMVIIDSKKHKLDYQRSYKENGIAELKKKWMLHETEDGKLTTGASTLISRSNAEVRVPMTKGAPNINPNTGEKTYKEIRYVDDKGRTVVRPSKELPPFTGEDGSLVYKTKSSKQMYETNDARILSSGTIQEEYYAEYANKLKTLANQARKESLNTPRLKKDREAAIKYTAEVASLQDKLDKADLNRPRERRAQSIVTNKINALVTEYPELKDNKKELKKLKQMELDRARAITGADGKGTKIHITDKEWEAIQSGAISDYKLVRILEKADADEVRKLATPRTTTGLTGGQMARLQAMYSSGNYTMQELSEQFGKSVSTISKYVK